MLFGSIYEMSLSNDSESKDLAISLFWTSNYVKDNNITPELQLYVTEKGLEGPRSTIGYYLNEKIYLDIKILVIF